MRSALLAILLISTPIIGNSASTQANSATAGNDLTQHAWRLLKVSDDVGTQNEHEIFVFGANGQFNIVSDCNLYAGKYKADETGALLITSLENTKENCGKQANNNVMLRSLIMAQRYAIEGNALVLLGENGPLIKLEATEMPAKSDLQGKHVKAKKQKGKKSKSSKQKNKVAKKPQPKKKRSQAHHH
jgi:heat shock protein HslJ